MTSPAIELCNATVVREGKKILDHVTLSVFPGEDVAIIGPNGAGKSTLIDLISHKTYAVKEPGADPVKLYGKSSWNIFDLRRHIGIVSDALQKDYLRRIRGFEVVLSGFFGSIGVYPSQHITDLMREKAVNIIETLDLTSFAGRCMSDMSTGEARRFLIARALVNDPEILVLDEPFAGLDLRSGHGFMMSLRKIAEDKNILMVTHNISEIIPEVQRVIMLKEGRVFADGKKENVLTSEMLSELYEVPLSVHRSGEYYSISYI